MGNSCYSYDERKAITEIDLFQSEKPTLSQLRKTTQQSLTGATVKSINTLKTEKYSSQLASEKPDMLQSNEVDGLILYGENKSSSGGQPLSIRKVEPASSLVRESPVAGEVSNKREYQFPEAPKYETQLVGITVNVKAIFAVKFLFSDNTVSLAESKKG